MSVEEILKEFPKFETKDIYEVSSFVGEAMEEWFIPLPETMKK
jgi:uncharacterized protein (DUF433 family)